MGTRSTTHFIPENSKTPILSIYRQFDGYPEGHGQAVAEFLAPFMVVNGYSTGMKVGSHANGIECLAAQFVAAFKTSIGNIYITSKSDRQEYDYFIHVSNNGNIRMVVKSGRKTLYDGSPKDYDAWLATRVSE